jgi:hypothetical protein
MTAIEKLHVRKIVSSSARITEISPLLPGMNAVLTHPYGSAHSLSGVSYASDKVFSDSASLQLPSVRGDPGIGYAVTIPIDVFPLRLYDVL